MRSFHHCIEQTAEKEKNPEGSAPRARPPLGPRTAKIGAAAAGRAPAAQALGKRYLLIWKRYEIESYLVHPDAVARYVEQQVGTGAARPHLEDLHKHFEESYPPAFLRDPFPRDRHTRKGGIRNQVSPCRGICSGMCSISCNRQPARIRLSLA